MEKEYFTFTQLSKKYECILIERMEDLMKAFEQNKKIIVLEEKTKGPTRHTNNGSARIPTYFKDFVKQNDERWARQEQVNNQILTLIQKVIDRIDNIVKVNNLKE